MTRDILPEQNHVKVKLVNYGDKKWSGLIVKPSYNTSIQFIILMC
jgi:hypothetical protein